MKLSEKKKRTGNKWRGDLICVTCRVHTVMQKTKHGWVCKECGTVIRRLK